MTEPSRLSKRVAELARCSRADADLYIEGGWVSVDGKVIEAPQHMVTDEYIEIDSIVPRLYLSARLLVELARE